MVYLNRICLFVGLVTFLFFWLLWNIEGVVGIHDQLSSCSLSNEGYLRLGTSILRVISEDLCESLLFLNVKLKNDTIGFTEDYRGRDSNAKPSSWEVNSKCATQVTLVSLYVFVLLVSWFICFCIKLFFPRIKGNDKLENKTYGLG